MFTTTQPTTIVVNEKLRLLIKQALISNTLSAFQGQASTTLRKLAAYCQDRQYIKEVLRFEKFNENTKIQKLITKLSHKTIQYMNTHHPDPQKQTTPNTLMQWFDYENVVKLNWSHVQRKQSEQWHYRKDQPQFIQIQLHEEETLNDFFYFFDKVQETLIDDVHNLTTAFEFNTDLFKEIQTTKGTQLPTVMTQLQDLEYKLSIENTETFSAHVPKKFAQNILSDNSSEQEKFDIQQFQTQKKVKSMSLELSDTVQKTAKKHSDQPIFGTAKAENLRLYDEGNQLQKLSAPILMDEKKIFSPMNKSSEYYLQLLTDIEEDKLINGGLKVRLTLMQVIQYFIQDEEKQNVLNEIFAYQGGDSVMFTDYYFTMLKEKKDISDIVKEILKEDEFMQSFTTWQTEFKVKRKKSQKEADKEKEINSKKAEFGTKLIDKLQNNDQQKFINCFIHLKKVIEDDAPIQVFDYVNSEDFDECLKQIKKIQEERDKLKKEFDSAVAKLNTN